MAKTQTKGTKRIVSLRQESLPSRSQTLSVDTRRGNLTIPSEDTYPHVTSGTANAAKKRRVRPSFRRGLAAHFGVELTVKKIPTQDQGKAKKKPQPRPQPEKKGMSILNITFESPEISAVQFGPRPQTRQFVGRFERKQPFCKSQPRRAQQGFIEPDCRPVRPRGPGFRRPMTAQHSPQRRTVSLNVTTIGTAEESPKVSVQHGRKVVIFQKVITVVCKSE